MSKHAGYHGDTRGCLRSLRTPEANLPVVTLGINLGFRHRCAKAFSFLGACSWTRGVRCSAAESRAERRALGSARSLPPRPHTITSGATTLAAALQAAQVPSHAAERMAALVETMESTTSSSNAASSQGTIAAARLSESASDNDSSEVAYASWPAVLHNAQLAHLAAQLPELFSENVDDLVLRVQNNRVGVLATLARLGVRRLSDRQALASELGRVPRRVASAAAALSIPHALRESLDVAVSINVHECPHFILRHLEHIQQNMPAGCRYGVVINANHEMHRALNALLPSAFDYDCRQNEGSKGDCSDDSLCKSEADAEPARVPNPSPQFIVLVHPQPLNKQRFHGSLLQGIVRNIDFARRRWNFDAFLILSSRNWFRRPLTFTDLRTRRSTVPHNVKRAMFKFVDCGGGNWIPNFVDASGCSLGPEMIESSNGSAFVVGSEWCTLLRTKLAAHLFPSTILQSPHEGLLLESAACMHALAILDGELGADLYKTDGPVEEMALQSIAHSQGLRFCQLSDMGQLPYDNGVESAHSLPLTKIRRVDLLQDQVVDQV